MATAAGLAAYVVLLVSRASVTTAFLLAFVPLGQVLACAAALALTRRPPDPAATGDGGDVTGRRGILSILDACAARMTFPCLDNGYVYPAAARLTGYRSATGWALVIEVFGFSPRAGSPDVTLYNFASELHGRQGPDVMDMVWPIEDDAWQDPDDGEEVAMGATTVRLRGRDVPIPPPERFAAHGIALTAAPRLQVFELCRALAAEHRELVLATPEERRARVPPGCTEVLQLEEWHHPDMTGDERPSGTEAFRQIAAVLETGDPGHYRPTAPPNTHWSHWPEAGTL